MLPMNTISRIPATANIDVASMQVLIDSMFSPRHAKVFTARWRDPETGRWNPVRVVAYTQDEALRTVEGLVGHSQVAVGT